MITETLAEGDRSKKSTLTLYEKVTANNDQVFTCRVTLDSKSTLIVIEILLKTFEVRTTGAEIQSGQSATLTCKVIEPTDPLSVSWYSEIGEKVTAGVTQEIMSNNTISSYLELQTPRSDANFTCRVEGQKTYDFLAEVLIDDIILSPAGEIRALTGSEAVLTCGFISNSVSEGYFQWKYNRVICSSVACEDTIETPKSSTLQISVGDDSAGKWECSFIKARTKREVKSEVVLVTQVKLEGTQTPVSLWGLVGDQGEVFCSVPVGLTFSELQSIEWILGSYPISDEGVGLNENNEVASFTFGEKETSETELTWSISFSHSPPTVGQLKCRASYNTGEQIETGPSYLNLITLTQDQDYLVITPNSGAVITFTSRAEYSPKPTELTSSLTSVTKHSLTETITHGFVMTEVVELYRESDKTINFKDDLSVEKYDYKYTANVGRSDEISVSGKAVLVGETFVQNGLGEVIWVVVGGRARLEAYFSVIDLSVVRVTWEWKSDNLWSEVTSDGYSSFIAEYDVNVAVATLQIDRVRDTDVSNFRAQIEMAGSIQTTGELTLAAVSAVAENINPVFEGDSTLLVAKVVGPGRPVGVRLTNEETGKVMQVNFDSVEEYPSNPFDISHQLDSVKSGDGGYYFFTVTFESGLSVISNKVLLTVRRKCRPLSAPPNTVLTEINIPDSFNYKLSVSCADLHVFMNDNYTEAVCNTDSGEFDSVFLTPCLRVIDVPEEESNDAANESGNSEGESGNTEGESGNTEGESGNTEEESGNTEEESGNTEGESGNTEEESGNTEEESGNTEGESGNTEGESGNTEGESGNTEGESGNTEGESGNTEGESGSTEGESGNTGGESGTTEGDSGNTEGESGKTEGESGNTEGESGNTEGESGNTEGESGNTEGESGNTEEESGNTEEESGNTEGESGNTEGESGNTEGESGNTEGESGNTEGESGNTEGDSGNTEGQSDGREG